MGLDLGILPAGEDNREGVVNDFARCESAEFELFSIWKKEPRDLFMEKQ